MKPGEYIMQAAKKQAEGEVAVHIANIKTYQTMPAGIGEHSDITEAVIEELNKLAAADDRLEMINKYFQDEQLSLFS
tara:strand:+ start:551 stop:781 length:231 start_codon:yes stop_codon:yes gene_type:complete